MQKLTVNDNIIQDAINIKNGVYAPLVGFLGEKDFRSVLDNMRLTDGSVWSIPIVLDIEKKDFERLKNDSDLEIVSEDGARSAVIADLEFYRVDKKEWMRKVYGTADPEHPGVDSVAQKGEYLVGGRVISVKEGNKKFSEYNFSPSAAKKIFNRRGWQRIVAFQTRNVPHRGHEFLQLHALAHADGLFIQPVIGDKKMEDFKDEYIISAYELLIDRFYPKNKVVLGILPLRMRYAGPREAVMHALIRRNYGCTHFIVGRDHAGVGDYYADTAAQEIFDNFKPKELGIAILKYDEVVYNKKTGGYYFIGDCDPEDAIRFSGTKLRNSIKTKQEPPAYIIRREIFAILTNSKNLLVDDMYKNGNAKTGFVLWFTGLSSAGKSTIADKVFAALAKRGLKSERLDGDIVRENLTKDLGFSRADRDENIRRIGFVAGLLSKNGVAVVASFISPYRHQREELRRRIPNFIEVHVATPLEVCESRDRKGLYRKARSGEIPNFTGISDPYEEPESPEICLQPDCKSADECAAEVMEYLEERGLI